MLFVGNHSGGNMTPDSMVFVLAFNTYFGVERPVYALAHTLVTSWPVLHSPSFGDALREALTPEEQREVEAHLRPRVEAGDARCSTSGAT